MLAWSDMRTVDRVLAYVCAVTAVFSLAFAAGRLAGPSGRRTRADQPDARDGALPVALTSPSISAA